jgi:hypothetical protein
MSENEFTYFDVDIPSVDYMSIKKQAHGNICIYLYMYEYMHVCIYIYIYIYIYEYL